MKKNVSAILSVAKLKASSVEQRTGTKWITYKLGYSKRPPPFLRERYSKRSPNLT